LAAPRDKTEVTAGIAAQLALTEHLHRLARDG
jgi:hypothetical protein